MSSSPASALNRLQATAATRRCSNSYFRQQILKSLHDVLRESSSTIIAAIRQDTSALLNEANAEFACALGLVKEHYEAIDPAKDLVREYRIARGENYNGKREPWGVVYIDPDLSHTPFFSIICAMSAALAAGNVVALKLGNSLLALPSLLSDLLSRVLADDIFIIVSSEPTKELLSSGLQVLQSSSVNNVLNSCLTSSKRGVIAIIDRSADLVAAAEHLVAARFSFGGTSSYAPDLVLVNEFVKTEFLEYVLRNAIRYLAGDEKRSFISKRNDRTAAALADMEAEYASRLKIIARGDGGAIIELIGDTQESQGPAVKKVSVPILSVSAITSLDDAIDRVCSNDLASTPLLAAYHFGTLKHAKYLAQFIKADVTFTNHVPPRLLLGPAAPAHQPFELHKRYAIEHFTRPRPAFASSPSSSNDRILERLIRGQLEDAAMSETVARAMTEIKEEKRAESIAIGFFEQGIFIGLGFYGVPILTCVGAGLFYAVRKGLEVMR